jgi:hypothetical protein
VVTDPTVGPRGAARPAVPRRKILLAEAESSGMDRQQVVALLFVGLMLFSSVAYVVTAV